MTLLEASPTTLGTPAASVSATADLPTDHAGVRHLRRGDLTKLALGAVGVVYGDIGTSPLYAVKECFAQPHGVAPTPDNIYGILSRFSGRSRWWSP
jgi:KUP system potassium uptake protein